jgi:hypothetical protein
MCLAFLSGTGCGDETSPDGGGDNRCGLSDPDCLGCQELGECCLSSNNCPVATICNLPSEPLFDSSSPEGVCLQVTCERDADCQAPKVCSLERICKNPVCQVDADCSAGDVCIGGACTAAPNAADVASCEVTTRDAALTQGSTLDLAAVARNENGAALAGVQFAWSSSDENVVSVSGDTATGGSAQGTATLTASVQGGSATCTGEVQVVNYPPVAGSDARVVVVTDGEGTPVQDATVEIDAGGAQTATTDATGAATFTGVSGSIASVTVSAQGYQYLTVIQPGSNDIFIPLPREPDTTRVGGFRGVVDISDASRGDIQLGFVGPALPSNLLDFGLESLVGDFIPTEVDAPELGLELTGMDAVDLPGGLMAALGNRRFTADATRCQGAMPGMGEIGCFLARAPEGRTAGWALAGQLRLRDVTSIATTLSDALGGGDDEELPIGDILVAVLPLLSNLNHAIAASLDITHNPTQNGEADFGQYTQQNLTASQELGVLSVVDVPDLPGPSGDCADAAVILAGANLEGRGLVPLGITAGLDTLSDMDSPDCQVAGVTEAFGSGSADTADGQMALALAPLHSGAEGSETFLLLVAADIDRLLSEDGFQATAIVERTPNGVQPTQRVSGSYLELPTGTVDGAGRTVSLDAAVTGATLNRYELQGNDQTWLVYAPSSVTSVTLPDVMGPSEVTQNLSDAYILSMSMDGQFSEVFEFGSGKTLDRLFDTITGFSVQQCAESSTAGCQIQ